MVVPTPHREPAAQPPPGGRLDRAALDTCLRVLASVRDAPLDDPAHLAVERAAAALYKAGKRRRKSARRADRAAHDRHLTSTAQRFRDEPPAAGPPLAAPALTGAPPTSQSPPGADAAPRRLAGTRRCYVCKERYRLLHPEYHLLCPACAHESLARRVARCDLRGRRAIVTGGRVKIGFHTALKLLRDGAEVLVTTRFPRDAARRFAMVPDAPDWLDRVHVHGVDLLDPHGVARLLEAVHERWAHLDILVNNAAQTVRRPAAYHRAVRAAEQDPLAGPAATVDRVDAPRPDDQPGIPAAASPAGARVPARAAPSPAAVEALFPAGRGDETGEPLDLRASNSWALRLHEVSPREWLEVHLVNAFVPFLLTTHLRALLCASPHPDRYVVQVSAMEGSFSRAVKTVRHPHTNMAKAALNMLTRTAAADYATSGIFMNSVDTGWVTDERPHPAKLAQRASGFRPPLDVVDGAARVYDPIVRGVLGAPVSGLLLKDFRAVEW